MCGIFCSISRHSHIPPTHQLTQKLKARGPDASNTLHLELKQTTGAGPIYITLFSTVLSLRGSSTTDQPYQNTACSRTALCWNGEAWTVCGKRPSGNDTACVFELLQDAIQDVECEQGSLLHSAETISRAMSRIAGPYAFVFFDEATSRLFFGRDLLGRRSLLYTITLTGDIIITSVTDGQSNQHWAEVEADGLYCLDLTADNTSSPGWGHFAIEKALYSHVGGTGHDAASVLPQLSLSRNLHASNTSIDENSPSVSRLQHLLQESIYRRITDIPSPPTRANNLSHRGDARFGVLFSGGLDCTTLARMTHDFVDLGKPIDLLNVAFENPRVHKTAGSQAFELCPDRVTGRVSYEELRKVCPGREWRFVAIDVPYAEFREHRDAVIALMHPHNTEMDLSIASALYFAARGTGSVASATYTTSARVLLSGLGADELFAGYTRHATAYKRQGFDGLLDELDLDVARLGKRNLGRDDRVISHWAREARFPFLDEALVSWALQAPISEKCDFGATRAASAENVEGTCADIEPGKKVLRCLAFKLGLKQVAREKKRAIQFGARTAKMETGKTKGTTVLG